MSELNENDIREIIRDELQKALKEHCPCATSDKAKALMSDPEAVETLADLGGNMSKQSAQLLARITRIFDKASFDIGAFLLKTIVLGLLTLLGWLLFKKVGS
jgi:hypothetical protein